MDYLLKTEPTVYSFADLQREQNTVWDGVTNPVAVKHLREMKPGDRLVIYETGDHKSAVGTGSVVSKNPAGEDQSREGAGQAGDPGRSQSSQTVRRLAAGAAGKTQRGAAEQRAVQILDRRVSLAAACAATGLRRVECREP